MTKTLDEAINAMPEEQLLGLVRAALEDRGARTAAGAKVLKTLQNRNVPRARADTDAKIYTDTADEYEGLDEDQVMLELSHKTPPRWVERLIRASLKAGGFDEARWLTAWEWFRTWNITAQHTRRIKVKALKGWLKKPKGLGPKPVARAKAAVKKAVERVATPSPERRELAELSRHAPAEDRGRYKQRLEELLGKDGYAERVRAMMARFGVGAFAAAAGVHGAAVLAGEVRA